MKTCVLIIHYMAGLLHNYLGNLIKKWEEEQKETDKAIVEGKLVKCKVCKRFYPNDSVFCTCCGSDITD